MTSFDIVGFHPGFHSNNSTCPWNSLTPAKPWFIFWRIFNFWKNESSLSLRLRGQEFLLSQEAAGGRSVLCSWSAHEPFLPFLFQFGWLWHLKFTSDRSTENTWQFKGICKASDHMTWRLGPLEILPCETEPKPKYNNEVTLPKWTKGVKKCLWL